jgi:hypothetical protein
MIDKKVTIKNLGTAFIFIANGLIKHIKDMYPSLRIRFKDDTF